MQDQILRYVFFAIALQALVFALVFFRFKRSSPERTLGWYELFYCSAYVMMFVFFLKEKQWQGIVYGYSVLVFLFSLFPVYFYFFISRMVRIPYRNKDIVHLMLPFFLLFSVFGLSLLVSFENQSAVIQQQIKPDEQGVAHFFYWYALVVVPILLSIQPVVYLYLSWIRIQKFRKKLKESYSTLEGMDLQWARRFLLVFFVLFIVSIAIRNELYLYSIVLAANLFIGVETINGRRVRSELLQHNYYRKEADAIETPCEASEKKYGSSSICQDDKQRLYDEVQSFMLEKKVYLNPGFTLTNLSQELKSNRQYVSQVINELGGKNFYTFVNTYRIEEFIRKYPENYAKNMSVEGMASQVGFLSKSSFYTAFKEIKGCSPKQFIVRQKLNN